MTDGDPFDPVAAITRSWWIIVSAVALGSLVLAAAVTIRPVDYTSTTTLLFSVTDPSEAVTGVSGAGPSGDPDRALNTQLQIVDGDAVVAPAAESLGLTTSEVREHVSVEAEPETNVLRLSGRAGSAEDAQRLVTAVAESYIAQSRTAGTDRLLARADTVAANAAALSARFDALPPVSLTQSTTDPRRAAYAAQIASLALEEEQVRTAAAAYPGQVSVLSAAEVPLRPSSPTTLTAALVGAGLGLVLGCLVAVLREPRRNRDLAAAYPAAVPRTRPRGPERDQPVAGRWAS